MTGVVRRFLSIVARSRTIAERPREDRLFLVILSRLPCPEQERERVPSILSWRGSSRSWPPSSDLRSRSGSPATGRFSVSSSFVLLSRPFGLHGSPRPLSTGASDNARCEIKRNLKGLSSSPGVDQTPSSLVVRLASPPERYVVTNVSQRIYAALSRVRDETETRSKIYSSYFGKYVRRQR